MQEPIVNDAARTDGRGPTELRPVSIQRGFVEYAEGSCLLTMGQTRIICAASVEDGVPGWLRGKGKGWVTAEYRMLPRATLTRTPRETNRIGGRTHEIQRLIGRSLRSVVDLTALGERTVWVDCDVLQADGGTRTASVTGAMVALYDALRAPGKAGRPAVHPVTEFVAAVSVGLVGNFPVLDLCYGEDVSAGVDMNVVMTEGGRFVEVQGTAEGEPFTREALDTLLDLAASGVRELVAAQKAALGV